MKRKGARIRHGKSKDHSSRLTFVRRGKKEAGFGRKILNCIKEVNKYSISRKGCCYEEIST